MARVGVITWTPKGFNIAAVAPTTAPSPSRPPEPRRRPPRSRRPEHSVSSRADARRSRVLA
jgi:hypothetical protein